MRYSKNIRDSNIGEYLFLPPWLLLADTLDFVLEQSLGLQVLPSNLDELLVVVVVLGVALVACTCN